MAKVVLARLVCKRIVAMGGLSPQKPELLAPAGDWEALKAAVANGADAVYFGLQSGFNARHRAHNFDLAELPEVMKYLHSRGVKGYVTFNTLIFADELTHALTALEEIHRCQVDAVIVQDLGMAWAIQQLLPGLAVHASTQMTMTEPLAINKIKELGVQRVILARELSVQDVGKIHQATEMPLEVFIHGALCVAYSGQCLTSEALGGRSANRGQCAQACRMPYDLLVNGQQRDLGDKAYLISPRDLAAYELVVDLIQNGVVSFKIEGRLKKGDYVAATVQTYRQAIDAGLKHAEPEHRFTLSPKQRLDLEQTFSRGLTPGFLGGINHQNFVPGRSPKKRGVRIGTVVSTTKHGVLVELTDQTVPTDWLVKPGDGIVFDQGNPEGEEAGGRVWAVRDASYGNEKGIVEIALQRDAIDLSALFPGSLVWKTDDPALRKRLEKSYVQDKAPLQEPVNAHLTGVLGGSVQLTLTSAIGRSGKASWPGPLESAIKHPTTLEVIREQLGRLNDTPYRLNDVTSSLPENIMLPKSVLNDLRRQAVTQLMEVEEAANKPVDSQALPVAERLQTWRQTIRSVPGSVPTEPQLYVLVRTMDQLTTLLQFAAENSEDRPNAIYCDFEDVRRYRDAITLARPTGIPLGVATLRIIKPGEESWLRLIAGYEPDVILVRNLGSIIYYRQHAPNIPLIGDFSLNIVNDLTAHWYAREGLQRMVPGFDSNWEQLQALLQQAHPAWFEVVVHYHMPMFHNEHCVFAALLSQGKDWRDCGRPCDHHRISLRDRTSGSIFPVLADAGCRNTVYNALPQSAAEFLPQMLKLGLRHFRVELLQEDAAQIGQVLRSYWLVLRGEDDGRSAWKKLRAMNQMGVTRGTLQLV
jgi:putative protease